MKYDIFISYRRKAEFTAKAIKESLEVQGHKVFLDIESMRAGDFNVQLYEVIENCIDFLVVLPPNGLDRCVNEEDWVRLEIAHALKHHKNIIPVMQRDFKFPETLPADIDAIRYKHGLEANSDFFNAFIEKLQTLLISKPNWFIRIIQNPIFKKLWPTLLSICLVAGSIFGVMTIYNQSNKIYPNSRQEINLTNEVFLTVQQNMFLANSIIRELKDVVSACENYLNNSNQTTYSNAINSIDAAYTRIRDFEYSKAMPKISLAQKLDNSPYDTANVMELNPIIIRYSEGFLKSLLYLKGVIDPNRDFDSVTRKKMLTIKAEEFDIFAKSMVLYANYALLPISKEYDNLFSMREELTYSLHLPFDEITWQYDEQELKLLTETNFKNLQENMTQTAELVGNERTEYNYEKKRFIDLLIQNGFTAEKAEAYVQNFLDKNEKLEDRKRVLEEALRELERQKAQAKEKFAPKPEDDGAALWGKALRFLKLQMPNEAIGCLQAYQIKMQDIDSNVETYVPIAIDFIKQIKNTGIDYGLMIIGYEFSDKGHEFLKIGDIIIAVNNMPCRSHSEYSKWIIPKTQNNITILRHDEYGNFLKHNYTMQGTGTNRTARLELSEL